MTPIAVVVIGYRNEATIVRAVRSVCEQAPATVADLIVVTSGGDRSAEHVRGRFPAVAVIERAGRLLPGAARNLGLAATRAPTVAFLEGDCRAEAGWLAARLARHAEKPRAVASAIINGGPHSPAGWAAHYLMFSSRLPGRAPGAVVPPDPAAHGLSVPREALLAIGGFREDLRIGEDTDLACRLHARGMEILFDPAVRTAHFGPAGTRDLIADQFRRGARRARAEAAGAARAPRSRLPRETFERFRWIVRQAWRHEDAERRRIVLVAPWLLAGAAANSAGWTRERLRLCRRAPATPGAAR